MVLQADLIGAVIRSSRELDCPRRAWLERCPQIVLSSEREAGALKKPGQTAPLDPDGSHLALVVPSRVRDAKRVHAFQIGVRPRSLDRDGRGQLAGAPPLDLSWTATRYSQPSHVRRLVGEVLLAKAGTASVSTAGLVRSRCSVLGGPSSRGPGRRPASGLDLASRLGSRGRAVHRFALDGPSSTC